MEVKRCINCMEDMKEVSRTMCPHCGYDNADTNISSDDRLIRNKITASAPDRISGQDIEIPSEFKNTASEKIFPH